MDHIFLFMVFLGKSACWRVMSVSSPPHVLHPHSHLVYFTFNFLHVCLPVMLQIRIPYIWVYIGVHQNIFTLFIFLRFFLFVCLFSRWPDSPGQHQWPPRFTGRRTSAAAPNARFCTGRSFGPGPGGPQPTSLPHQQPTGEAHVSVYGSEMLQLVRLKF